jgi:clan AA aspartic protease
MTNAKRRRFELIMGLTFIEGIVTGPTGKSRSVKFLVDSGASYSLLPLDVWQEIGLESKKKATFTLADGTTTDRHISECHVALADQEGHSPVILGQPGDEPLLGVITLANLGLVLDPFQRTLHAMKLRLG